MVNTGVKLQLVPEDFIVCVYVSARGRLQLLWMIHEAPRSVMFLQSDIRHFQCKTMHRTWSWREGKAAQSSRICLQLWHC